MKKGCSMLASIVMAASLHVFVLPAYGTCLDECIKNCDATIDERFRWGEEFPMGIKASTDYLKMKNDQKTTCYAMCEEQCPDAMKRDRASSKCEEKKEAAE